MPSASSPASVLGAVLPAAGAGLRMGGASKQFRTLGSAPVLVQTARTFAAHPDVGPLVVVVPADRVDETADVLAAFAVEAAVVAGGATRQVSVRHGVLALPDAVTHVLVHDAVRPFVTAATIAEVAAAVRAHGAAAAAVPVADTLRRADGTHFGDTVDRDGLWAMQTPQGARRDWLLDASAASTDVATDEVGLLQAAGHRVRVVEGDTRNLKLTRPSDWSLAEALWASLAADRLAS